MSKRYSHEIYSFIDDKNRVRWAYDIHDNDILSSGMANGYLSFMRGLQRTGRMKQQQNVTRKHELRS